MIRKVIFLFFITLIISSCNKREVIIPDFSTPETGFETAFYATFHRDPELILDTSSHEMLAKYGTSREEQLKTVKADLKGSKKDYKSKCKIIRTEYIDETHANVYYKQFYGSKLIDGNMRILMIKEDGKWKVALDV
jgi:hypothetical protein